MRKIILSTMASLSLVMAFGQQTTQPEQKPVADKTKSVDILPVEGDFGLTIGAGTTLNYIGNFFGKNATNANSAMFNYANKNYPMTVIAGKYFLSDDVALRLGASIYYNNSTTNYLVHDDTNLDPDAYVNDKAKVSTSGYTIGAGIEKRRGYKRLQGIYGAELYFGNIGRSNYDYDYGNKFSQANEAPTSSQGTTFSQSTSIPKPSWGYRLTSEHTSNTFSVGARALVGLEYFFAKKMSIGGEFYWGLQYQTIGKQSTTWEYYNTVLNEIKSETINSKRDHSFNIGLSNIGGNLNLNFYF